MSSGVRAFFRIMKPGRRPGEIGAPTVEAGARHVQRRAGAGGETGRRRQGDDRVHHGSSSLSGSVASGIPSRAATFFWMSMIASACSNLRPSRAFSRLAFASSAARRLPGARLGPGLAQCAKHATVAQPAPLAQGRRVQPFPAQDRPDPAGRGRAVTLRSGGCTLIGPQGALGGFFIARSAHANGNRAFPPFALRAARGHSKNGSKRLLRPAYRSPRGKSCLDARNEASD
jgi:hypothetical protein